MFFSCIIFGIFSDTYLGDICSYWNLCASIANLDYCRHVQQLHVQGFKKRLDSCFVRTIHQRVS